jgi:hypothetical protein
MGHWERGSRNQPSKRRIRDCRNAQFTASLQEIDLRLLDIDCKGRAVLISALELSNKEGIGDLRQCFASCLLWRNTLESKDNSRNICKRELELGEHLLFDLHSIDVVNFASTTEGVGRDFREA